MAAIIDNNEGRWYIFTQPRLDISKQFFSDECTCRKYANTILPQMRYFKVCEDIYLLLDQFTPIIITEDNRDKGYLWRILFVSDSYAFYYVRSDNFYGREIDAKMFGFVRCYEIYRNAGIKYNT